LAGVGLAAARVTGSVEASPVHPEGFAVMDWDRAHPVWSAFSKAEGTGPDRARARRFLKLQPVEGARVIAEFERAMPAAVELVPAEATDAAKGVGRGRVVQLAFGLDASVTDFPKKKAFVPFVHGLARYLAPGAEAESHASVEIGAPLPVGKLLASSGQGAELIDPDGESVRLASGATPPLAERPGVHRLRYRLLGRTETAFFAANAPAAESDLRTAGEGALLAALGSPTEEDPARPAGKRKDDDETARSRLWAIVLGVVAALLLLESMLANRVILGARRPAASGTGGVEAEGPGLP